MHLASVTANLLHQVLNDRVNIVYNPTASIFDKILFSVGFNFYIFGDTDIQSDNCCSLTSEYVDLYNYDLYIHNDIAGSAQVTIPRLFHTNMLIFEHNPMSQSFKKEDRAIINSKLIKNKKIFFNSDYQKSWGLQNSFTIPYGLPVDILHSTCSYADREGVLLLSKTNQIVCNQIQSHLKSNNIRCEILNMNNLSLAEINDTLNKFKVLINLENDYLTNLACVAAGCNVATIFNGIKFDIPNCYTYSNIQEVVSELDKLLAQEPNPEVAKDYALKQNDFDLFKVKISDIIQSTAKREAFVL